MANRTLISNCCGCGACVSICPKNCIDLKLNDDLYMSPYIDSFVCIDCGDCLKVCSRYQHSTYKLMDNSLSFYLLGSFNEIWIGFSTNPSTRRKASSGGLVRELCKTAIDGNIAEAILLMNWGNDPFRLVPRFVETISELDNIATSFYTGSNLLTKLTSKELQKYESVGVVGLPCQLQSLRNLIKESPLCKEKVKFCIGLFCSLAPNLGFNKFLINKKGIRGNIVKIEHRGNGWPGLFQIHIEDRRKTIRHIPRNILNDYFELQLFKSKYCFSCNDQTAEFADISLGDAWIKRIREEDKLGTSIIVERTGIGHHLVEMCQNKGRIKLKAIDPMDVIRAQGWPLYKKKKLFSRDTSFPLRKRIGAKMFTMGIIDILLKKVMYMNHELGKSKAGLNLLKKLPYKVIRRYARYYRALVYRRKEYFLKEVEKGLKLKKIVILNKMAGNHGDEIACKGLVYALRRKVRPCQITLLQGSGDFNEINETFLEPFSFGDVSAKKLPIFLIAAVFGPQSFIVRCISHLLGRRIRTKLRGTLEFAGNFRDAQLVISGPAGPYFGDEHFQYSFNIVLPLLSIVMKKEHIFYAPSMGPFYRKYSIKNIMRRLILEYSSSVTVRDNVSLSHVRHLGYNGNKLLQGCDAAFLMPKIETDEVKEIWEDVLDITQGKMAVGMCPFELFRNFKWRREKVVNWLQDEVIHGFAECANYLISKLDGTIVFIPQLFGTRSDMGVIEKICSLIDEKRSIYIVSPDVSAETMDFIIGKLHLMISIRYHPIILSIKNGIPFVAIGYEHKTEGILNIINMNEYLIKMEDFKREMLLEKVQLALQNMSSLRGIISVEGKKLQKLAEKQLDMALESFVEDVNTIEKSGWKKYFSFS